MTTSALFGLVLAGGASIAALTVYDMCKALSHEIVVDGLHLVAKSGGKRRVRRGRGVE